MKRDQKNSSDASQMRREAGAYLAIRGNRLLLATAAIVVLSVVVLYAVLFGVYSALTVSLASYEMTASDHTVYLWSNAVSDLYVLFIWLLTLFFTMPLFYGLFSIASRMTAGKETVLSDVFLSFSSMCHYKRAVRLAFSTLYRATAVAGIVMMTYFAAIDLSQGSMLIGFFGAVVIVLEIALALILSANGFFTVYFAYTEEYLSITEAREKSKRLARACRSAAFCYVVDYLPWLILSFATAGVLFVADTLPRMLISYFRFSEATNDRFYQSEEIKDHE